MHSHRRLHVYIRIEFKSQKKPQPTTPMLRLVNKPETSTNKTKVTIQQRE